MIRKNEESKYLSKSGYFLKRSKKHNIWTNKEGAMIVASSTPSCSYSFAKLKKRIKSLSLINE